MNKIEYKIRKYLWLNHSYKNDQCTPYGDDGEMQCCGIDFKRMSIELTIDTIVSMRSEKAEKEYIESLNNKKCTCGTMGGKPSCILHKV